MFSSPKTRLVILLIACVTVFFLLGQKANTYGFRAIPHGTDVAEWTI